MRMIRAILCFPLLFLASAANVGAGAASIEASQTQLREIANLHAFARLYGVLRFFHPSDEAAAVDWNRYAILGVKRVRGARDTAELESLLEALVLGIAPTVQILETGERVAAAPMPAGDVLVSWQHRGPGFTGDAGSYRSKRTGRDAFVKAGGKRWTSVTQSIGVQSYRGKPFRLHACLRSNSGAQIGAWAEVHREDGTVAFSDDMRRRMISSEEWTDAVIEGSVGADADQLVLGAWLTGFGDGWLDDFTLTIDGKAIEIRNPGFEEGVAGWGGDVGRGLDEGVGYAFDVTSIARNGAKALHIAPRVDTISEDLFEERVAVGEVAEVDLGDGLSARVPLAVWSKGGHTMPASDPASIREAYQIVQNTINDADARIADLIVAWSVFDQFYPYFDVTGVDWQAELDRTLLEGLNDSGSEAHEHALARLVSALEDGHGTVVVPGSDRELLPLRLAWTQGKLVVLDSTASGLIRGDVIEAIDGVPASAALESEMARYSGSPQWRRVMALRSVGARPTGELAELRVARLGEPVVVFVGPGVLPADDHAQLPIAQLESGIWYVDLTRASSDEVAASVESLARARGVIFDLRGRPISGPQVILGHLLTRPDKDRWMHVAHIVRPALPGAPRPQPTWESSGWQLEPAEPRIAGHVVFVTDARAISYAESVMGYVEALGITIVGSATAGANGDTCSVQLPTGSIVTFTGRRVTRHDGSRSHLLGIRPTILVEPTVAGIRAGRDEVLDRALEVIRALPGDCKSACRWFDSAPGRGPLSSLFRPRVP